MWIYTHVTCTLAYNFRQRWIWMLEISLLSPFIVFVFLTASLSLSLALLWDSYNSKTTGRRPVNISLIASGRHFCHFKALEQPFLAIINLALLPMEWNKCSTQTAWHHLKCVKFSDFLDSDISQDSQITNQVNIDLSRAKLSLACSPTFITACNAGQYNFMYLLWSDGNIRFSHREKSEFLNGQWRQDLGSCD